MFVKHFMKYYFVFFVFLYTNCKKYANIHLNLGFYEILFLYRKYYFLYILYLVNITLNILRR